MPMFGFGGIERVFLHLAGYLTDEFDVHLCAQSLMDDRMLRFSPPEVHTHFDSTDTRLMSHSHILVAARKIRDRVIALRPDVLVSAFPRVNATVGIALRSLRVSDRPRWIATEHGDPSLYLGTGPKRLLKAQFVRFSIAIADVQVSVSRYVADCMRRLYRSAHVDVLPNPVYDPGLLTQLTRETLDFEWDREGCPTIVSVGRITKGKDQVALVRAFCKLRTSRRAKLLILGDGEERAELEALARALGIEDDVILPGFVENPFKYVAKCQVLVHTSRSEGLPLALVEAMAIGVPVVTTRYPGVEELITHGHNGLVVPVGDVERLAAAIDQVLNDAELANRLVQNGKITSADWTIERAVSKYRQVIRDVMGGSSRG